MLKSLNNIVDHSVKLVETKRRSLSLGLLLVIKLVLLLLVATASFERIFFGMTFFKNTLRNKMGIRLLDDQHVY